MKDNFAVKRNSKSSAGESIFCSVFVLLNIFVFFFANVSSYLKNFMWVDFSGQWKICAYTVRGIDPYTQIGTATPAIESLGAVPEKWRASPWGCLIGNVFYPGYLSYSHAQVYFRILCAVVFIAGLVAILKSLKPERVKDKIFYILVFCSFYYYYSVIFGNAGGMCCCLLIVACIICEKHPYCAGILIGIAMVKPQIALIICFALLLMKKIKTLFVAAGIDIAALLAVSLIIRKNPIDFTLEFFSTNVDEESMPGAIFSFMSDAFGFNSGITLISSMLFGTVITVAAMLLIKKYKYENLFPEWFIYFVPFIASSFWSYRWRYDDFIIIFACLCCVYVLVNNYSKPIKIVFSVSLFYLSFKYIIIEYLIKMSIGLLRTAVPAVSDYLYFVIGINTLYDFGIVFIAVIMTAAVIAECKKYQNISEQNQRRESE